MSIGIWFMKNTFYTASIFFQIMTMTLLDRRLFTKIVVKLYVRNQFTLLINTTQYLGHGLNNIYVRINRGIFSLQCKMSYSISELKQCAMQMLQVPWFPMQIKLLLYVHTLSIDWTWTTQHMFCLPIYHYYWLLHCQQYNTYRKCFAILIHSLLKKHIVGWFDISNS